MSKRNYTHIQEQLPEIQEMIASGKTQRKVADILGIRDKYVVKERLKRERKKLWKIEAGIILHSKGRPRKNSVPRDIAKKQQYEIERLKMENQLLRNFLKSAGRMRSQL